MYIIKLRTDAQRLQRLPSANGLLPNCPRLFPRSPEHSALWGMRRGAHMIVKRVGHSADFIQSSQFPSERNANMPMQNLCRHRSESGRSLSVHLATSTDTNVGPIRERHSAVKRSDAHAASDRTLETCRSVKRPDMKGHRGYYVLH